MADRKDKELVDALKALTVHTLATLVKDHGYTVREAMLTAHIMLISISDPDNARALDDHLLGRKS
ncbi:MAG: hypothetical protein AAFV53_13075 [Myxococcota bacterium]